MINGHEPLHRSPWQMAAASTLQDWREDLPPLTGPYVELRELTPADVPALHLLLSDDPFPRFGLTAPVSLLCARHLALRAAPDRAAGRAMSYAVFRIGVPRICGLFQVRQLNGTFETSSWDFSIAPALRGGGLFGEAARLLTDFLFDTIGVCRLEARVAVPNGRGNGAMRKLGAVPEGMLRRSARQRHGYVDQVLWTLRRDDRLEEAQSVGDPLRH